MTDSEVVCPCGRAFLQASALTKHQRSCSKCKKRLSSALEKAKSLWNGKRRRVLNTATGASSEDSVAAAQSPLPGLMPTLVPAAEAIEFSLEVRVTCAIGWKRMFTTVGPVAHGQYRRFASHIVGTTAMDSAANQPQAAEEISRRASAASCSSSTGAAC